MTISLISIAVGLAGLMFSIVRSMRREQTATDYESTIAAEESSDNDGAFKSGLRARVEGIAGLEAFLIPRRLHRDPETQYVKALHLLHSARAELPHPISLAEHELRKPDIAISGPHFGWRGGSSILHMKAALPLKDEYDIASLRGNDEPAPSPAREVRVHSIN